MMIEWVLFTFDGCKNFEKEIEFRRSFKESEGRTVVGQIVEWILSLLIPPRAICGVLHLRHYALRCA